MSWSRPNAGLWRQSRITAVSSDDGGGPWLIDELPSLGAYQQYGNPITYDDRVVWSAVDMELLSAKKQARKDIHAAAQAVSGRGVSVTHNGIDYTFHAERTTAIGVFLRSSGRGLGSTVAVIDQSGEVDYVELTAPEAAKLGQDYGERVNNGNKKAMLAMSDINSATSVADLRAVVAARLAELDAA